MPSTDPPTLTCWACGAPGARPGERFAPARLHECAACGLAFQADTTPAGVAGLYDDAYFAGYAGAGYEDDAQRAHEAARRVAWLRGFASPPGRLLELGSAAGHFLAAARAAGWDAAGIEPSAAEGERARDRLGVDVRTGTLEDHDLAPGLAAVVAWHVLEHIPQPLSTLERVRALLAPGGVVCLEVPNAQSTMARLRRGRWPLLGLPEHVSQFGPASLRALLERAGLRPVALDTIAVYRYFRARQSRDPRRIAGRLALSALSRTMPTGRHPTRHELLRAVATAA